MYACGLLGVQWGCTVYWFRGHVLVQNRDLVIKGCAVAHLGFCGSKGCGGLEEMTYLKGTVVSLMI
jgi:hypothetical protein